MKKKKGKKRKMNINRGNIKTTLTRLSKKILLQ